MVQGVPVVAPRITGIPELVEDGVSGLLYTPGDAEQLVGRIEMLLADADLRNRCGEAGRQTVSREFNLAIETGHLGKIVTKYLGLSRKCG